MDNYFNYVYCDSVCFTILTIDGNKVLTEIISIYNINNIKNIIYIYIYIYILFCSKCINQDVVLLYVNIYVNYNL